MDKQVYTSLPPVEEMITILEKHKEDASVSYDPQLYITDYTYKKMKDEYSEEDFVKISEYIADNSVEIRPVSPVGWTAFDYVYFPYDEEVPLPSRSTEEAAGYDIYLPRDITLIPGQVTKVCLGVKCYMYQSNPKLFLGLYIRSHFAGKIELCNSVGIIDADYATNPVTNGEIQAVVKLSEQEEEPLFLAKGERLVQGVLQPYYTVAMDIPRKMKRGASGSTGN